MGLGLGGALTHADEVVMMSNMKANETATVWVLVAIENMGAFDDRRVIGIFNTEADANDAVTEILAEDEYEERRFEAKAVPMGEIFRA